MVWKYCCNVGKDISQAFMIWNFVIDDDVQISAGFLEVLYSDEKYHFHLNIYIFELKIINLSYYLSSNIKQIIVVSNTNWDLSSCWWTLWKFLSPIVVFPIYSMMLFGNEYDCSINVVAGNFRRRVFKYRFHWFLF